MADHEGDRVDASIAGPIEVELEVRAADLELARRRKVWRSARDLALLAWFLTLALAALGMYGVLSFLVRARTREIGVRVALGATPRGVATLVVRQAMTWTAIGGAIGVTLTFLLTRFLATLLYGISPTDPATFAGVILLLAGVSFIAALIPALRASRLDPLGALRTI